MRRKTIPVAVGKLLLERFVPPGRPIKLDLPYIRTADDLTRSQEIITDALNAGAITPTEAAAVQAVIQQAWRSRLEANEHPNLGDKDQIDPVAYRERICNAARAYGMVHRDEDTPAGSARPAPETSR